MPDDPYDDVRARLAAEPDPRMPADVAARLHQTLAAEAQARESPATPATVTALRRRGRWRAPLLAAAAIVAIVAIGIPIINQSSDRSGGGDAASSGDMFARESGGRVKESRHDGDSAPDADRDQTLMKLRRSPMALHRATFSSDVSGYLGALGTTDALALSRVDVGEVECPGSRPRATDALRATLDGEPAAILTRKAPNAGVRVRAVVCGDDGPMVAASTTLHR